MLRLKIDALKIFIKTSDGDFGTEMNFSNGLNIIRADNTSGKSTCLNSILYALGLEIILGKKGSQSLKPVLKEELEFQGKKHPVLESYVELQITNFNNKSVTLKRFVKGEYDDKLIILYPGKKITENEQLGPEEYYYVHDKGAATQSKGFHNYLKDFLGWELPEVSTFNDSYTTLYIECIFPLMFIEQFRGWSGIQATTPTFYGIKNVKKIALEFLLNLDVSKIDKQKIEILNKKEALKRKWNELAARLENIVTSIDGIVKGYPLHPVSQIDFEDLPQIYVKEKDEWILVNVKEKELVNKISQYVEIPDSNNEKNINLKNELDNSQNQLFYFESKLTEIRHIIYQGINDKNQITKKIESISIDVKKNQDVLKIQNFGIKQKSMVAEGLCPTCHQEINRVLLPQSYHEPTMSIEENIEFLKQQSEAATIVIKNLDNGIRLKEKEISNLEREISIVRQRIKDLKNDLISSNNTPNISEVRERIILEESLKNFRLHRINFENDREKLFELSKEWAYLLKLENELPKDSFSDEDNKKLNGLAEYLSKYINSFDYKSTFIEDIHISRETYKPLIEGFEMISDASASDNIRLIWAYTIALQSINSGLITNHLGISIFDEPGQQEVEPKSLKHFYQQLNTFDKDNNQFIIATSVSEEVLNDLTKDLSVNLKNINKKEKILIRLS